MTHSFEKTIRIAAPQAAVWAVLTHTDEMLQWMGGEELNLRIETDWAPGHPIRITGWHHLPFENKGTVLQYEPHRLLAYNHLSSISRLEDRPENYTTFRFELSPGVDQTELTLTITGFPTDTIFYHLRFYWQVALEKIKAQVEQRPKPNAPAGTTPTSALPTTPPASTPNDTDAATASAPGDTDTAPRRSVPPDTDAVAPDTTS